MSLKGKRRIENANAINESPGKRSVKKIYAPVNNIFCQRNIMHNVTINESLYFKETRKFIQCLQFAIFVYFINLFISRKYITVIT